MQVGDEGCVMAGSTRYWVMGECCGVSLVGNFAYFWVIFAVDLYHSGSPLMLVLCGSLLGHDREPQVEVKERSEDLAMLRLNSIKLSALIYGTENNR